MVNKFIINKNQYLKCNIIGYYNRYYTGYGQSDNPNFLNTLKNTFNNIKARDLDNAKNEVENILMVDIPEIMRKNKWNKGLCVCIPRAKKLSTYTPNQLLFRDAVSKVTTTLDNVIDGSDYIVRHTNTRTTHLKEEIGRITTTGRVNKNDGELPYRGITKNTCLVNSDAIRNQNIILIDDIYTNNVNIDEDCIQTLLDKDATNVIFYAIAYTRMR